MYFGPSPMHFRDRIPSPTHIIRSLDCHLLRHVTTGESVSLRPNSMRPYDLERPCCLDPLAARQIFTVGCCMTGRRQVRAEARNVVNGRVRLKILPSRRTGMDWRCSDCRKSTGEPRLTALSSSGVCKGYCC